MNLNNFLIAARQVRALVQNEGYDLVHVHTPVAAFITRFALRRLRHFGGPRVIYTAHGFHFHPGGSPIRNAVFRHLEQIAGRWTDYLVVINRDDEAAARAQHIVPSDRLVYMPGIGVDTDRLDPERVNPDEVNRVRASLGLAPGQPLFSVVGELNPGKRHCDVLMAFQRLATSAAHLALVGDGPLLQPTRELAAKLGIADRVHFLGYRRDIPALIRSSVALLLFSEREGLPRSIMEALSLEVPVVGTDIRGIRDLLEDSCGLLAPVGDVEQLASAMQRILDQPDDARAMGRRGRAWMQERHSLPAILKLHEQLYARALDEFPAATLTCTGISR